VASDETQQQPQRRDSAKLSGPRAWLRWIGGSARQTALGRRTASTSDDQLDIPTTLASLPALLDSSNLPNGVVELVIEDFEAPTRQLFDIHDGHTTLVEPGQAVPWTSIAGPLTAWALALGPQRNTSALELTGDEQLALRVLAALPPRD
jgi:hypothetical protein